MKDSDTICAIATGMGQSAIGIIRISGEDAIEKADKIFRGKRKLSELQSFTASFGGIYDGDKKLDEVIALVMRGPHTYTTEDTVELDCHGGPLVMKRVLELLIREGIRPAEPGEFTKRAFLGGRIDMTEAEAVMDVISAENDMALASSLEQLSGRLKEKTVSLRDRILHETAFIESAIDDPEHFDLTGYEDHITDVVNGLKAETEKLIAAANAERDQIISELEKRNSQAQSELDNLTEQARRVMAEAEEAAAKRDELLAQNAAAKEELKNQIESVKADLDAREKELNQKIKAANADLEVVEAKKNTAEEATNQLAQEKVNLEGEIKGLKGELDDAKRIIADSKKATVLAEAAAQEIVLNAEKQAVFLKEAALSESEKGSMMKQIDEKEEKIKELEKQIKEKEMEKAELEKKLAALDESVAALEKRVREGISGAGDGPKEYSVEVVGHNRMSEVDVKALNELLKKKSSEGWKLVSAIDDDGGKIISSLGGAESASLSGGSFNTKEDRLVLIFERPAQDNRRVR